MEKGSNCGISITGAITAVLIALKIGGVLQCSWWLVFTPLMIGVGVKLLMMLLAILFIRWQERRW